MTRRLTGSLAVCTAAGLFTLGTLLVNPQPRPAAAPASPAASPAAVPATAAARPGAAPPATPLAIADFRFAPVSVPPGGTVAVTNADGDEHTVTATDGSFAVRVGGGATATFTAPARPGSYAFVCDIHPSMRGRLVVA